MCEQEKRGKRDLNINQEYYLLLQEEIKKAREAEKYNCPNCGGKLKITDKIWLICQRCEESFNSKIILQSH